MEKSIIENTYSLNIASTSFLTTFFIKKANQLIDIQFYDPTNKYTYKSIFIGQIEDKNNNLGCYFVNLGNKQQALLKFHKNNSKYTVGQKILVQITKEATYPNKSPVVSDDIFLEGNYIKYKPKSTQSIFTKTIAPEDKQLLLSTIDTSKEAIVLRSSYKRKFISIAKEEIMKLISIYKNFENAREVGLVYKPNFIENILFDNSKISFTEISSDSQSIYLEVEKALEKYKDLNIKNSITSSQDFLLDVISYLEDCILNEVELDETTNLKFYLEEAFSYIDVDYKGNSDYSLQKEEAFYKKNSELIKEIINLIIIKNLSGQIFIDLLKMRSKMYKNNIIKMAQDIFNKSSTKATVLGFSNLGVLEISRQKINDNVKVRFPSKSSKLLALSIIYKIKEGVNFNKNKNVKFNLSQEEYDYLIQIAKEDLFNIQSTYSGDIVLNVV